MSDEAGGLRRAVWSATEGRLRTPWRLAVAGALFIALGTAIPAGAMAVASQGAWLQPALRAGWVTAVAAAGLAVAVGAVLGTTRLLDGRRLSDVGLERSPQFGWELAVGAAVGAAAATALVVVGLAVGVASVGGVLSTATGTFALTSQFPLVNVAFWLVVFLGVGIVEEVLLRGYVLVNVAEGLRGQTADDRRATMAGVLASVGLFGALYAVSPGSSNAGVVTSVGLGAVLAATVALTGRLALALGLHVAWNVTLGLGFGLPVSGLETGSSLLGVDLAGPSVVTGGSLGPGNGLVALAGLAVAIASLGWWLRRRGLDRIDGSVATPTLRERPDGDSAGASAAGGDETA